MLGEKRSVATAEKNAPSVFQSAASARAASRGGEAASPREEVLDSDGRERVCLQEGKKPKTKQNNQQLLFVLSSLSEAA